jgi:hypothetical protein
MSVSWTIEGSVVIVTIVGDYDRDEISAAYEGAMADPEFRPGSALLVDLRSSITYSSREETNRRVSVFLDVFHPRGLGKRIALVAPAVAYRITALERAAALLCAHGVEAEVFHDRQEADAWVRDKVS